MSYAEMVMRDGIVIPINKKEYDTMVPKIRMTANIKMYRNPDGHYVILTPSNLQMIRYVGDMSEEAQPIVAIQEPVVSVRTDTPEEPKKREYTPEELAIIAETEGNIKPAPEPEEKEDPLADMIAKSNCKHGPELLGLYRQHTAKGIRYFPVCSFCGKRERYVSESKIVKGDYAGTPHEHWTENDIANAQVWVD